MKRPNVRFGVLASSVAVAVAGAAILSAEPAAAKDRYDLGEEVPAFTLKVVNAEDSGESYVSLDKFVGANAKVPKKAVIVSFFATYCEPCKREIPLLSALYDSFSEAGLQILLVTIDKEADKIDEAKGLVKNTEAKFPLLSDRFNIVARRYFIEKLPCVYILDAQGKVSMVNVGYGDDVSKLLLDEIRKNLGQPISDPVPEPLAKFLASHAQPVATTASAAPAEGNGSGLASEGADGKEPAVAPAEPSGEEPANAVEEPGGKKKKKKKKAPPPRGKKKKAK